MTNLKLVCQGTLGNTIFSVSDIATNAEIFVNGTSGAMFNGSTVFNSTENSTNLSTGPVIMSGGLIVKKNILLGGSLNGVSFIETTGSGSVSAGNLYLTGDLFVLGTTNIVNETITNSNNVNITASSIYVSDHIIASGTLAHTLGNLYAVNGNIGINDTNPGSNLSVIGNVNIAGNAVITSSTTSNSRITDNITINSSVSNANINFSTLGNAFITNGFITNNTISNVISNTSTFSNALIVSSTMSNAFLTNGIITNGFLTNGTVSNGLFVNATVNNGLLTNAIITNTSVNNGIITNATINNAILGTSTTSNFFAVNGTITNGTIPNAILINSTSTNIVITNSSISNVNVNFATVTSLYLTGSSTPVVSSQWISGTASSIYFENYVGINTSSPGFNLDVSGVINAQSFYTGNSSAGLIATSGNLVLYNSGTGTGHISRAPNQHIVTWTSIGNVGIGTSVPTSTLSVNGIVTISSGNLQFSAIDNDINGFFENIKFKSGSIGWNQTSSSGNNSIGMGIIENTLVLGSTGNVGIGTTNPSSTLSVNGDFFTTTASISNASITNASIANGTITNASISNGIFTNGIFTNGTITNGTITNGVFTNASISNGIFTNAFCTNGTVNNCVFTNASISNGIFTNAFCTNGTVNNVIITSSSTTNALITNGIITNCTIPNGLFTNSSVTNAVVTNSSVTNAIVTNSSISSTNVVSSTVSNVNVTNSSMSSNLITNSTISNNLITLNTVVSSTISNSIVTNTTLGNLITFPTNLVFTNSSVSNFNASNAAISNLTSINATLGSLFTTNGNIGINTTSPSDLLTVNGNVSVTGNLTVNTVQIAPKVIGKHVVSSSVNTGVNIVTVTLPITLSSTDYRVICTLNTTNTSGNLYAVSVSSQTVSSFKACIARLDALFAGWTDTDLTLSYVVYQ